MRLSTHETVQRIWTVRLHPQPGGPLLSCPQCTATGYRLPAASARSAALTHLARHARRDVLPRHLRTCQCRARNCSWHPRHRGCAGPVLLALTCDRSGRVWRLADACAACAAATTNTAVVPDTLLASARARPAGAAARHARPPHGPGERLRVREMLTYLGVALPRFSSPAARLLALQCALRADVRGRVRLPSGLLRSMRLHSRSELWSELEHAGWLRCSFPRRPHAEACLLDADMQTQTSGRGARARAAHWALRPVPLVAPRGMSPTVQLTALVLAAHTSDGVGSAELDVLARLGGQSPQQVEDLLDQLVRCRLLAAWQHLREHDEICWRLPERGAPSGAAPGR
ncbi:hypothetical protein [Streptomyces ureilyticus]|uniref:Uncharacterized protein n=1 Tax=Streptomyces ureilyticus TaxID=1775131 RepID=A0ABX0DMF2_9ACTN|nr:hypothetical protein [Streptomyces ureilyticus]NGO43062.1 hypothetical protein [Streptomyces ureilyticus]